MILLLIAPRSAAAAITALLGVPDNSLTFKLAKCVGDDEVNTAILLSLAMMKNVVSLPRIFTHSVERLTELYMVPGPSA